MGFEPMTFSLARRHSTTELRPRLALMNESINHIGVSGKGQFCGVRNLMRYTKQVLVQT